MTQATIRTKGRGGFTTSLNIWIESPDLDAYDFRVAMWLASHTAEFSAGISQRQIARTLSMSQERVMRSLACLEKLGMVLIEDGGFRRSKQITFDLDEWARPLATREVSARQTSSDISPDEHPEEQGEDQVEEQSRDQLAQWFDEWYAAYPKHVERKAAEKAYRAALKAQRDSRGELISPESARAKLLTRAQRFAILCEDAPRRYVKGPAVWLNKGCYDDEDLLPERWRDGRPLRASNGHYDTERPVYV